MRVQLINPGFNRYGGISGHGGTLIPINLCYLAAYGREKHPDAEFSVLDAEIRRLSHDEAVDEVVSFSPDLIGITATTPVFDSVMQLTKRLKDRLPKSKIIIGGSHTSALPERSLDETAADFVAMGEGETLFGELISQIKAGDEDWGKINGIAYRDEDGDVQVNPPAELIHNLDDLPMPARDLMDNSLYHPAPTKRVSSGRNTLLTTSRGCPYNCGFCSARIVWTRAVRYHTSEHVVAEMEDCVDKYGIESFYLTDELFTVRKERVLELCGLIYKRGLNVKWTCFSRAERLDRETLEAMKEAGCSKISFGIEAGNPEILKKIDKSLDLGDAKRVVDLTKEVGIKTHASYMFGYIGETEEMMQDTMDVAKHLNTQVAAFFTASPLPGTPLYEEAIQKGYLLPDVSWINYSPLSNQESAMEMPDLKREVIRKWHRKAIRNYYLRPSYILSRLFSIRHGHEVKNMLGGLKILANIRA